MSGKLMGQAYTLALPRAQKSVLVAMCDHANDDGHNCFPGVDTLASKTGYCVRQVQRAQAALEAAGLIVAVENPNGGRGQKVKFIINLYSPIPVKKDDIKLPFKRAERMTFTTNEADLDTLHDDVNHDILSPFSTDIEKGDIYDKDEQKDDISDVKGDILHTERVTLCTVKGDISDIAYKTDAPGTVNGNAMDNRQEKNLPPSLGNEAPEGALPPADVADAVVDRLVAKGGTKKFIPPTEDETIEFFKSIKATDVDAKKFFLHFSSNGWKVSGRAKMVDWHASARGWMLRSPEFAATGRSPTVIAENVVNAGEEKARREFKIEEKRVLAEKQAAEEMANNAVDAQIEALEPRLKTSLSEAAKRRLKKLNPIVYTDEHLSRTKGATALKLRATMREIYLEKKANVKPGQDQNGDGDPAGGG